MESTSMIFNVLVEGKILQEAVVFLTSKSRVCPAYVFLDDVISIRRQLQV